ncbi:ABC transporter permease subunit [Myxococcus sp. MISCRS1]|jgi:ABC-type dipeptide/oligopeptide/nickel transport system permease component|uniref:ABC transporter permease subunit n=1 Tax=unclassified Myxococcus TaxID=2648731 RepID=UPI001CBEBC61|nr:MULTISPECIES: ABC transporter permease subunit [unclassified Myxococcus]MBZ4400490.1 ABC transporter permease subunit [Myxococcus sp. AS-1-15]MCY0997234.1 ABC transporter permease subunit [Myxococcus sp. MISCRS1]
MMAVLQKLARQLVLVPVVAVASYFLMAMLPLTTESDAKRQASPELMASYRRDLGLGEPLGFLRPWEKLWRGERLGTSAQGITGDELARKLSGSVGVGMLALPLALTWALSFALIRTRWRRGRWSALGDVVPALAFGTPVFIPALLLAPAVVERGHMLPELCAALVTSIWPGIFLGTLVGDSLETELSRDYVRTALGKGLSPGTVLRRHVLPNVLPSLLDAVGPVATALLAGSFAAERVLGLPYFGQLYVLAVLNKQVAVVVVATTTFASLLVVVSLVVEVARYVVDPRSREARA